MGKKLFDLLMRGWHLMEETAENKTALKEIQLQVEALTHQVQLLAFELRRQAEHQAHEREKLALRFENELLRLERRLSGGGKPKGLPGGKE